MGRSLARGREVDNGCDNWNQEIKEVFRRAVGMRTHSLSGDEKIESRISARFCWLE